MQIDLYHNLTCLKSIFLYYKKTGEIIPCYLSCGDSLKVVI